MGFISKFHKFAGMVKIVLYVTVYLQVSPWKHKHLDHNCVIVYMMFWVLTKFRLTPKVTLKLIYVKCY